MGVVEPEVSGGASVTGVRPWMSIVTFLLLLLAVSIDLYRQWPVRAQSACTHTLKSYPVGALLVFRNGVLQNEGEHYAAIGQPIVVTPLPAVDAQPGERWTAVYSLRIWLAREDWVCK